MSLFDGTQNFTPALEGQRIAIGAGQGAAQGITSGLNASTARKGQELRSKEFEFQKKQYNDQIGRLDAFKSWLDSKIGGAGDWVGESGPPDTFR